MWCGSDDRQGFQKLLHVQDGQEAAPAAAGQAAGQVPQAASRFSFFRSLVSLAQGLAAVHRSRYSVHAYMYLCVSGRLIRQGYIRRRLKEPLTLNRFCLRFSVLACFMWVVALVSLARSVFSSAFERLFA